MELTLEEQQELDKFKTEFPALWKVFSMMAKKLDDMEKHKNRGVGNHAS